MVNKNSSGFAIW